MVIQKIMMERAHAWVWHEEPEGRQPTTPSQQPLATKSHRQADFTPRAVGTGATENRGGRVLGQAYQQNQCAGNSCSMEAHVMPWLFMIAAMIAACSIQHANMSGTRR